MLQKDSEIDAWTAHYVKNKKVKRQERVQSQIKQLKVCILERFHDSCWIIEGGSDDKEFRNGETIKVKLVSTEIYRENINNRL